MKSNQDNYSRMRSSHHHLTHHHHHRQPHCVSLMSTFLSMYVLLMILLTAAAAAVAEENDEGQHTYESSSILSVHDHAETDHHFHQATTETTTTSPLSFSFMRTGFSSSNRRRLGNLRGVGASSAASAQSNGNVNKGRTVLTFLYLSILGLCFLTPILYYCRLYFEERNARRMRDAITTALEQSHANASNAANGDNHHHHLAHHAQNREEARAVRRKYVEERRARILQLFEPVRMVLREENFPQSENGDSSSSSSPADQGRNPTKADTVASTPLDQEQQEEPASHIESNDENDTPPNNPSSSQRQEIPPVATDDTMSYEFDDEDSLMIEIPLPGLSLTPSGGMPPGGSADQEQLPAQSAAAAAAAATPELRQVPGVCTICLSAFKVGSDIVWSSNSACEHVFHEACIEKWLMKQREGPLCPCCRRDFIVDPYDMEEVGDYDYNNNTTTTGTTSATGAPSNAQNSNNDNVNDDDNNIATATALTLPTTTTTRNTAAATRTSNPISFLWMRASAGRNNDASNHDSNNGSTSA